MESRNVVFIETPSNMFPAARRLSPQQDLESPSFGSSNDTCDNYVSHDDMLWDVQNYTTLWISVSTRPPERYSCFRLNTPHPA